MRNHAPTDPISGKTFEQLRQQIGHQQAQIEQLERLLRAQSDSIKAYEDEVERLNFLGQVRNP